MTITKFTAGAVALATALALAACSDDDDDVAADATAMITTDQVAGSTDDPDADIEAAKNLFIGALDDLGIEHSDPVGSQPQLAGVKARFDFTVDGFDTGINVFPDQAAMEGWQEASDSYGDIHVDKDLAALSLDNDEGAADSAKIAPRIAELIDGTAYGI